MLLSDSSAPRYLNDLRQLHTATMTWSLLRTEGDPPTARCGHSAVLVGDGAYVCFFGGWGRGGNQCEESNHDPLSKSVHLISIPTLQWSVPSCRDKRTPKHLYFHNACILDTGMVIYGGFDGRQASNVLGRFDFSNKTE